MIYSGFKFPVTTLRHHIFFMGMAFLLPEATVITKSLYNTFDVVPQFAVPFLIMGDRLYQAAVFGVALTYFMSIDSKWSWVSPSKTEDPNDKRQRYSVIQAICRLSYSLYLVNYFVVKTEFFTSRTVFPMSWYNIITRIVGSLYSMMNASLIFHLIFVAPFDNLRRSWVSKIVKSKSDDDETNVFEAKQLDENQNSCDTVSKEAKKRD